jgi:hypothetical protein
MIISGKEKSRVNNAERLSIAKMANIMGKGVEYLSMQILEESRARYGL